MTSSCLRSPCVCATHVRRFPISNRPSTKSNRLCKTVMSQSVSSHSKLYEGSFVSFSEVVHCHRRLIAVPLNFSVSVAVRFRATSFARNCVVTISIFNGLIRHKAQTEPNHTNAAKHASVSCSDVSLVCRAIHLIRHVD